MSLRSLIAESWKPPAVLPVSEWADRYRQLSFGAEPGQWRTDRTPYLKAVMDVVEEPGIDTAVLMFSAQSGKALALDTPIATPAGWKFMGDLKVSDQVFDENGKACDVVAVAFWDDRPCYRVAFSDGSSIVADVNHEWRVNIDSHGVGKISKLLSTGELIDTYKSGKRNNYSIPVAKPLMLPDSDLPIDPYVLGFWLGDGSSASGQITLSTQDREVIGYLESAGHKVTLKKGSDTVMTLLLDPFIADLEKKSCKRGHLLSEVGLTKHGHCRKCSVQYSLKHQYGKPLDPVVRENQKTFYGLLKSQNLINNKHIPAIYLRSGFEQRMELLRGLMDSDGYIDRSGKRRCEFCTTSENIRQGFCDLISSLGLKYTIKSVIPTTSYKGKKVEGKPAYRISFMCYEDKPIFKLKRKLDLLPSREGRRTSESEARRIVDIERVENHATVCIQVNSPSHLFLAGETMIPTHNSEALLNILGKAIHLSPCPILLLQPTLEMAESFSKERLAPMLRDTPVLSDKVRDPRSRDSNNTLLHKVFTGGYLALAGANSPASLASRPIQLLLCDEIDRYPISAGTEGDPVSIAVRRTATFWNRFIIMVSTPTIAGASRIETAFENSDKRLCFVPCPLCGHEQVLDWVQVEYPGKGTEFAEPEGIKYRCVGCGELLGEVAKFEMIARHQWRKTGKEGTVAGFHLNALYSPWQSWRSMAEDFERSRKDDMLLRVWWNTMLGLPWQGDAGDGLEWEMLLARSASSPYRRGEVPERVVFLTAGVDVQGDRLAVAIWGWAEESWLIDYAEILGDPLTDRPWEILESFLGQERRGLRVRLACVDTGYVPTNLKSH